MIHSDSIEYKTNYIGQAVAKIKIKICSIRCLRGTGSEHVKKEKMKGVGCEMVQILNGERRSGVFIELNNTKKFVVKFRLYKCGN